ncbi:MAG: GatB/YqeY domain-containing protein [Burkholderiaceae bacterium]
MNLKNRISSDMKAAMRARESERLSAIRMLLAAIQQKEVDERIELDDAQVVTVVDKLCKQRRDSIEQYTLAGRQDLADRERAEIEVLSAYLPAQADEAEIAAEIEAAITTLGAAGPQDMGKVMGLLKQRLAGRADLSAVSAGVRARLSGR